ncbi:uncharacterized protein EDB93DRAFT_1254004 [Suillus bovinus]|uniref:uncharacterized protein n=1 Tax=Suillus bovinus TaxID=48563 RepID=UPI001B8643A0|nr:uncharacterized protein EDB93DRAFT_1254004 [Suillus bovinus]KAG2136343.1 hypothetical protein EDB93DRAFT_1254004 [Suillus bovinus]
MRMLQEQEAYSKLFYTTCVQPTVKGSLEKAAQEHRSLTNGEHVALVKKETVMLYAQELPDIKDQVKQYLEDQKQQKIQDKQIRRRQMPDYSCQSPKALYLMHAHADLESTSSATSAQSISGHASSQEYDTLQQSLFKPFNDSLNTLPNVAVAPTLGPKMSCRKRARENSDENIPCIESETLEARKRCATSSLFSDSYAEAVGAGYLNLRVALKLILNSCRVLPAMNFNSKFHGSKTIFRMRPHSRSPPVTTFNREHERSEHDPVLPPAEEAMHHAPTESVNKRSLGQQRRRARERAEKERSRQVATPIASNEPRVLSVPRAEPQTPGVHMDVDIPFHSQLEHEHAEEQIEHGQPHHHEHEPLEQHPLCGADVLARPHPPL